MLLLAHALTMADSVAAAVALVAAGFLLLLLCEGVHVVDAGGVGPIEPRRATGQQRLTVPVWRDVLVTGPATRDATMRTPDLQAASASGQRGAGPTPSAEVDALLQLYDSTAGREWFNSSGWGVGDPCDVHSPPWYGVACAVTGTTAGTAESSTVVGLHLAANSLIGGLPPRLLARLPNLKLLDAGDNLLSGSLRAALHTGTNQSAAQPHSSRCGVDDAAHPLQTLRLSGNAFVGPLPGSSLGNLCHLTELDVSYNYLNTSLPSDVCALTGLTLLNVGHNSLSGPLPPCMGNLTQLSSLLLFENGFTGSFPSTIGSLTHLTVLDASFNKLSGSIPSASGLHSLTQLLTVRLGGNGFTGALPPPLFSGALSKLMHVDLSGCHFEGPIPFGPASPRMSQLASVDLSDNVLNGTIPAVLGQLTSLTTLTLANNGLTGTVPVSLRQLSLLAQLDLSGNNLQGVFPWAELEALSSLKVLSIAQNVNLLGTVPRSNPAFIGGGGGSATRRMQSLAVLNVSNCPNMTVAIVDSRYTPAAFSLFSLAVVDLTGTSAAGAFDQIGAGGFGTVTSLHMKACKQVTGALTEAAAALSFLDVRGTAMRGVLPPYLTSGVSVPSANASDGYSCARATALDGTRTVLLDDEYDDFARCSCESGFAGDRRRCARCPVGTHAPLANQSSCTVCRAGHCEPASTSTALECIPCFAGSFALPRAATCLGCPKRGVMCSEQKIAFEDGWWWQGPFELGVTEPYPCAASGSRACLAPTNVSLPDDWHRPSDGGPGGNTVDWWRVACTGLRSGVLCQECRCESCDRQRYFAGQTCTECGEPWFEWLVMMAASLVLVLWAGLSVRSAARKFRLKRKAGQSKNMLLVTLRTALSYAQVTGYAKDVQVPWPSSVDLFLRSSESASNPPLLRAGFNHCTLDLGFYTRARAVLLLPALAPVLLLLVPAIVVARRRIMRRCGRNTAPGVGASADAWRQARKPYDAIGLYQTSCLLVWYLMLGSVTRTVLDVLLCSDPIDGVSYVLADYSAEPCGSATHQLYAALAAAVGVVYSVGFPLGAFALLWRKRNKLESPRWRRRILFLWFGFRPQFFFWTVVIMARKLLVVWATSMLSGGDRLFAALCITGTALYLQTRYQPFRDAKQGRLESASLRATVVTLLGGLLFSLHEESAGGAPMSDVAVVATIIVVFSANVLVISRLAMSFSVELRKQARRQVERWTRRTGQRASYVGTLARWWACCTCRGDSHENDGLGVGARGVDAAGPGIASVHRLPEEDDEADFDGQDPDDYDEGDFDEANDSASIGDDAQERPESAILRGESEMTLVAAEGGRTTAERSGGTASSLRVGLLADDKQ